jgi:hypothetical protein
VKHWGKALIGVAVTVALLWWALAGVSVSEVWANVRRGDPLLLGAAVLVATVGFVVRAMRWRIFLVPVHPGTSLRSRFAAVAIHFMANNLLPLRVGEFARALVFSRLEPVKASAAFGTVVVERFMDGVVLLIFLVLPVLTPDFPDVGTLSEGMGGVVLRAAALGVLLVLAALIALAAFPRQLTRIAERIAPILPAAIRDPVLYSLASFLDSLAIMRDPKLLALGFTWSLGFWALQAASFWLGMMAFGIDTGYVSAVFTSSVVAFGVALPSAPGFVGTFHFAADFALSDVYGVSDAQSLAFAFGYHFGGWLPITVIGLVYLWRLGISLGDVGAAEERLEEGGTGRSAPEASGPRVEGPPEEASRLARDHPS